jgi:hypothetical protein
VQIAAGCRNIVMPKPVHNLCNGRARLEHHEREDVTRCMNPGRAKIALEDVSKPTL